MKYNPDNHHRRSIRLKGFDYSSNGMYYITICTKDRVNFFGKIVVGADLVSAQMILNEAGKMIETIWVDTIDTFPDVSSPKYVIMPNHIHCIVVLSGERADTRSAPTSTTIGKIVQVFNSKTTVEYIKGVKNGIYVPFNKSIWQRNYYEHIIRDEEDFNIKWNYIEQNLARWTEDENYSAVLS